MIIKCDVIQDLLPLYYDGVSSPATNELIEEHLKECESCSKYFNELKSTSILKENFAEIEDKKIMKNISNQWKKDKKLSFTKGAMLISLFGFLACIIGFQLIGSEVLSDGRLVEPFALIPLGYLFFFLFLIFTSINLIMRIIAKKNKKIKS